jgi:tRNA threonylcarbamoyladenosine biosynthesis protein TsaE
MMEIHFNLQSIEDTAKPVASMLHPGMPLLLFGEMGAGKTTLTKSIVRSLGCGEEVTSPTFPLMQSYQTAQYVLWHIDLYRLDKPHQTDELGLDELNHECILIIEWPELRSRKKIGIVVLGLVCTSGEAEVTVTCNNRGICIRASL